MNIEEQIDILLKGRKLILKAIENLSLKQINTIPEGFKNSIGWNVAHLVVTQQLLCYKLSNTECVIDNNMIEKYRKGVIPSEKDIISDKDWKIITKLFLSIPEQTLKDYSNDIFGNYTEYTTSVNVTLDSIEKAISFNNFHEGIHLGVILAQKKLV